MGLRLALETSGKEALVCLRDGGSGRNFEEAAREENSHNEILALLVQQVLRRAGAAPADLELVAAGSGPGSFTGLRIGYSFALGLALGLRIPFRGISSFEAMAWEFRDERRILVPVADARREEVFCACYVSENGRLRCLSAPHISPLKSLAGEVQAVCGEGGAGSGEALYLSQDGDLPVSGALEKPGKTALCLLDLAALEESEGAADRGGGAAFSALNLSKNAPLYIRAVSARTIEERKRGAVRGID